MPVVIIILLAIVIVVANRTLNKEKYPEKTVKSPEINTVPVARKYKILYWYTGIQILYSAISLVWTTVFSHQYKTLSARFNGQNHPYISTQAVQNIDKITFIVTFSIVGAVTIWVYSYLCISKNIKGIITILKILLGLEVLGIFVEMFRPNYLIIIGITFTIFTYLVLRSLTTQEPDFIKMVRQTLRTQKS
jgi:hypothetical protein